MNGVESLSKLSDLHFELSKAMQNKRTRTTNSKKLPSFNINMQRIGRKKLQNAGKKQLQNFKEQNLISFKFSFRNIVEIKILLDKTFLIFIITYRCTAEFSLAAAGESEKRIAKFCLDR